jgi:hypothetical protein
MDRDTHRSCTPFKSRQFLICVFIPSHTLPIGQLPISRACQIQIYFLLNVSKNPTFPPMNESRTNLTLTTPAAHVPAQAWQEPPGSAERFRTRTGPGVCKTPRLASTQRYVIKATNTTSPTFTHPFKSKGTKLPDASFFRPILAAHNKTAMLMKSVLSAMWRPTQILRPNPYVKCPRSLISDMPGAMFLLASRYRVGSK